MILQGGADWWRKRYDESQLWLLSQSPAYNYYICWCLYLTLYDRISFWCHVKFNVIVFFWSGQPDPDHSLGLPQQSPWHYSMFLTQPAFSVRRSRTFWPFHIDGSEQIRRMLESRNLSRTRGRQNHRPRVGRALWRLMEVLCCFGPELLWAACFPVRYSTQPWLQLLCGSHGKNKPT